MTVTDWTTDAGLFCVLNTTDINSLVKYKTAPAVVTISVVVIPYDN